MTLLFPSTVARTYCPCIRSWWRICESGPKASETQDWLFPGWMKKLYRMIQLDLRDAGIPYQTEARSCRLPRSGASHLHHAVDLFRGFVTDCDGTRPPFGRQDDDVLHPYRHSGSSGSAGRAAPAAQQPVTPGSTLHGRLNLRGGDCHKGVESDIAICN